MVNEGLANDEQWPTMMIVNDEQPAIITIISCLTMMNNHH